MRPWTAAMLALALAAPLTAAANPELAKEKQCDQCHKLDERSIGPSYRAIAAQWKGRANAQRRLVKAIQDGTSPSKGPHWITSKGAKMPDMSQRPLVNNAEAKELIAWILAQ